MLYEIKLDGVFYDILFYKQGEKKLRVELENQFPGKVIRIIKRALI